MPSAEDAYLFRHALLREAAYQLQPPAERAPLHAMAFSLIEQLFGGRAPALEALHLSDNGCQPHPTNVIADELAMHAAAAGMRDEHLLYLGRAAATADRHYRNADALRWWQEYADLAEGAFKAEALRRVGDVLKLTGRSRDALQCYEQAVALHVEPMFRGMAMDSVGQTLCEIGRQAEGQPVLEQALSLHRQSANRRCEGVTLTNLAAQHHLSGRIEQAEQAYAAALGILDEVGNEAGKGIVLGNLGGVYRETGRISQALDVYERALAINRNLDNRRSEGITLSNLALVYRALKRDADSTSASSAALAIAREIGDRRTEGIVLINQTGELEDAGRLAEAERGALRAIEIFREIAAPRLEGAALGILANHYEFSGRLDEAAVTYERALALNRQTGNRRAEGVQLCRYALLKLRIERPNPAETWRAGLALLREVSETVQIENALNTMREACAKAGVAPFDQ